MRFLFLLVVGFCWSSVFAQCPYDYNGDGVINFDGDLFFQLSQYGLSGTDLPTDHNNNGLADVRDHLLFLNYLGTNICPEPIDESDHILNLVLTEYYVHEEDFNGESDTIPAGSITYRLYIELAEEDDRLIGIFGDTDSPLSIQSTGGFHIHQIGTETPFAPIFSPNINAFISVFPEIEYTSWLTIAASTEDPWYGNINTISAPGNDFLENFENGGNILMDSEVGSAVMNHNAIYLELPEGPEGLQLIGQFTTLETDNISGTINAYIRTDGDGISPGYGVAEGLTFNEGDLSVLGCMDQEASNYNPEADYEDGSCVYQGDLDGDGEVSIEDLLIFIEEFGCMEDCGFANMNGDGVVNVADLILFLGLIN